MICLQTCFIAVFIVTMGSAALVHFERNISTDVIGLSEIVNGLNPSQLTVLAVDGPLCEDIGDFIYQIHKMNFKTIIFYDVRKYYKFIEDCILSSIKSYTFIFGSPFKISAEIYERNLGHRLNLFMFYWGAKAPPSHKVVRFREPMRVVIITKPRETAFRVFYNQAVPNDGSKLKLVNWYDSKSLGLYRTPLLPSTGSIYSNFNNILLKVPVFHSPPWFFVHYNNASEINPSRSDNSDSLNEDNGDEEPTLVNVTGGRDHILLLLLANRLNFEILYVDPPGRIQGSDLSDTPNESNFTGGIGMIQRREAHLLLGDVSLSWERRKAVEFSFFTLADSGAFVTHAPRRLNEALAILRPFKLNVWPYLILMIILSGPVFYLIIAIPYKWKPNRPEAQIYHFEYVNEITQGRTDRRHANHEIIENELPERLLERCIWFTLQLFLKQSCSEPYHGYRARFLVTVYWIAATYVLADVYSAQLTSEFARPAHESPINSLQSLQHAMKYKGYELFVEKGSTSLDMLENGTEIFRQLFNLMRMQIGPDGYLIETVEAGFDLITDGADNKAIMGGRETLYFNIRQFGVKNFQLSYKLYTRYSAVAVQIGCPFLDSLNYVLIRLFEGGILGKITNSEYEAMSRNLKKNSKQDNLRAFSNSNGKPQKADRHNLEMKIQPLNLRMLQGAYIILGVGYVLATLTLALELAHKKTKLDRLTAIWLNIRRKRFNLKKCLLQLYRYVVLKIIAFQLKYN